MGSASASEACHRYLVRASPERAVGAVVFDRTGRVLLIRRGRPPLEGAWTLPGGHVDAGEEPASAAEREVEEEAGLRVSAERLLETVDLVGDGYAYAIDEYLCVLEDDALKARAGDDAKDVRWVALAELESLGVSALARRVILRAAGVVGIA
jgi:8-oxo-dGTP diphosphatase